VDQTRNNSNIPKFSDFVKDSQTTFIGDKIRIDEILNKQIVVTGYRITASKFDTTTCLILQIEFQGEPRVILTGSGTLRSQIMVFGQNGGTLPFTTTIIKVNEPKGYYKFT
jgi:hypothetical protein